MFYRKTSFQILASLILGVLVGHIWGESIQELSILSELFLRMVKMIVAPLVFLSLVQGLGRIEDSKTLGSLGLKTFLYFQIATVLALTLGLISVNLFQPGNSFHIVPSLNPIHEDLTSTKFSFHEFVVHIIPTSFIEALSKNNLIQIVLFSLFFGVALQQLPTDKKSRIIPMIDILLDVILNITHMVMKMAPIGVFGAIAVTIGKHGISSIQSFSWIIFIFYGTILFFNFIILPLGAYGFGINLFKIIAQIKDEIFLAFGTASSESAFPKLMEKLPKLGFRQKTVSFVLPLGYSFNLDGSMIYMTFATICIAQMQGINIGIEQQISMVLILLLSSKGMAGIPRASLVIIASLLNTFQIPQDALLVLLGIDQILDMGRSATNVISNTAAIAIIDRLEKDEPSVSHG